MEYAVLKNQYDQNMSTYIAFCNYFCQECRCLLDKADIPYYEFSFRIKTWDSILEKIERCQLAPKSLDEIHDLIGFRVITLFKRDNDIIHDIIEHEFHVHYFDDKAQSKPENVFGYLSVHYEVSLTDKWLGAPSTINFKNIKAEIQVRTFSQHVWAASSHILQYKIESTIPLVMRRNIYRLAAVLEIVDNELENIRNFRDNYQHELEQQLEEIDVPLDSIMLENILDQFFPHENKRAHEPYDDMLYELFEHSVKTSEQLKQLLSTQISYVNEKEAQRKDEYKHSFYSYAGLLRIALSNCECEIGKEGTKDEYSVS